MIFLEDYETKFQICPINSCTCLAGSLLHIDLHVGLEWSRETFLVKKNCVVDSVKVFTGVTRFGRPFRFKPNWPE